MRTWRDGSRLTHHFAITEQCAYTITRPGPRTLNGSPILTQPSRWQVMKKFIDLILSSVVRSKTED
jgi:hypothetical protein